MPSRNTGLLVLSTKFLPTLIAARADLTSVPVAPARAATPAANLSCWPLLLSDRGLIAARSERMVGSSSATQEGCSLPRYCTLVIRALKTEFWITGPRFPKPEYRLVTLLLA